MHHYYGKPVLPESPHRRKLALRESRRQQSRRYGHHQQRGRRRQSCPRRRVDLPTLAE
jgi:hypothetical protein